MTNLISKKIMMLVAGSEFTPVWIAVPVATASVVTPYWITASEFLDDSVW